MKFLNSAKTSSRWMVLVVAAGLALVLALPAQAQSATVKQGQALSKSADDVRGLVQTTLDDFRSALSLYNEIIDGNAKKRESNYKKLASSLKDSDKQMQNAQKGAESLAKQADKFFKSWEKEIEGYSSDAMKEKSEKQLTAAKAKYASVGETAAEADKAFRPLAENFNDQVLYLGRDMSDSAIADIKPDAEELNTQAEEVLGQIEALLKSADGAGDAAAPGTMDAGADDEAGADSGDESGDESGN